MSLRFIDVNRVSGVPKSWRDVQNGVEIRIPWDSSVPWHSFYSSVKAFYDRNGYSAPSMETVENFMCGQMPGFCVGDQEYRPPAPQQSSGCGSCGRR